MTEQEFDNGYWYTVAVKAFADEIGIRSAAKLRKGRARRLHGTLIREKLDGKAVDWMEKVSDEQYQAAVGKE